VLKGKQYETRQNEYRNLKVFKILTKGGCLTMSKKSNIEISVSGHIDKALRQLKKKIEREGIVRDMKRTVYFESTTQERRKRLVRAIKQNMMRMVTAGTAPKD
jgi:small subunit ribosomal protein S21